MLIAPTDKYVVYVTCDSVTQARSIARAVIAEGLAACVNIVPGVESVYLWEGKLCQEAEWLLVIKTRQSALASLQARIQALHSYRVPEFVALAIAAGSQAYLHWMDEIIGPCNPSVGPQIEK